MALDRPAVKESVNKTTENEIKHEHIHECITVSIPTDKGWGGGVGVLSG